MIKLSRYGNMMILYQWMFRLDRRSFTCIIQPLINENSSFLYLSFLYLLLHPRLSVATIYFLLISPPLLIYSLHSDLSGLCDDSKRGQDLAHGVTSSLTVFLYSASGHKSQCFPQTDIVAPSFLLYHFFSPTDTSIALQTNRPLKDKL